MVIILPKVLLLSDKAMVRNKQSLLSNNMEFKVSKVMEFVIKGKIRNTHNTFSLFFILCCCRYKVTKATEWLIWGYKIPNVSAVFVKSQIASEIILRTYISCGI